jgi:hypothetical protein
MAHDHHHHGESLKDYFTEQLLTIFVVCLLGFVGIMMYRNGQLGYILAPMFHLPVLIGGIAILVIVAIRGITVWREAGAIREHEHGHEHHHEHDHGHAHSHDHGHEHHHHDHDHHDHDHAHAHHHDHDHSHSHDHGHHHHGHSHDDHGHSHDLAWVFTRMLILFFPVALFLIGVPNSGFSQDKINKLLGSVQTFDVDFGSVARGQGQVRSFNDLNDAAYDVSKRDYWEGKIGILEGRYRQIGERQFTLYRLKMTCCAADTIPLKVRIITPTPVSGLVDGDWVTVKGEVRFVQPPGSGQFIPVVAVADVSDVQKTLPKNEYEQ